jgi:hypothetical protein
MVKSEHGLPTYDHAFTVDQALSRLEAEGYSNVTGLRKDSRGDWHGKVVRDGKAMELTLEFNGTVTLDGKTVPVRLTPTYDHAFTVDQALSRLEAEGYSNVTGYWHAENSAMERKRTHAAADHSTHH